MLTKHDIEDALSQLENHVYPPGEFQVVTTPRDQYIGMLRDLQAAREALAMLCDAMEYEGTGRRWCHLCSGSGEKGGVVWHDNTCPVVNPQLLLGEVVL